MRARSFSGPPDLGDFDLELLRRTFAENPLRESAGDARRSENSESAEQLAWLFEKYEATHALLVAERPFTLLVLAMPRITALPGAKMELQITQRMALLISSKENNT